ncbi:phosphatase PAP2 family protein [Parasedimentitalea marina]|uniref:Phosphatase PAP2 family protein n=2 Tax=Parasedimentitalea marina TaxID=2483033 RepID=A0A3T0N354_9RHOB|nr:phosphatase PAP2 family protein [Parasedimentitalea marina]
MEPFYDERGPADREDFLLLNGGDFPKAEWSPDLQATSMIHSVLGQLNLTTMNMPTADEEKQLRENLQTQIEDILELRLSEANQSKAAEIIDQSGNFAHYFLTLLNCSARYRTQTSVLIFVCLQVASVVGLHFKWMYQRPRPAQIFPGMLPLIPTPAHSSFPSNHSTQSFLVAEMLVHAAPAATKDPLRRYVETMARRIAVNREIAGVHYSSDSAQGRVLAIEIKKQIVTSGVLDNLLTDCTTELSDFVDAGHPINKDQIVG